MDPNITSSQANQQLSQLTNADIIALLRSGVLNPLLGAAASNSLAATNPSSNTNDTSSTNATSTRIPERAIRPVSTNTNSSTSVAVAASSACLPSAPSNVNSSSEKKQSLVEQNRQQLASATDFPHGSGATTGHDHAGVVPYSENHKDQTAVPSQAASATMQSTASGNAGSSIAGGVTAPDKEPKKRGPVIVPCRARGMPMDHNFKTAYFVVPENVRHGEELVCSYPACASAGVKFCYCAYCMVPVARRNFRKRHKHLEVDDHVPFTMTTNDNADRDENSNVLHAVAPVNVHTDRTAASTQNAGIPHYVTMSKREEMISDQVGNNVQQRNEQAPAQRTEDSSLRDRTQAVESTRPASSDQDANTISSGDIHNLIQSRTQEWVDLLAARPFNKNGDAMSAWLMKVLAFSDPLNNSFMKGLGTKSGEYNVSVTFTADPADSRVTPGSPGVSTSSSSSSDEQEEESISSTNESSNEEDFKKSSPTNKSSENAYTRDCDGKIAATNDSDSNAKNTENESSSDYKREESGNMGGIAAVASLEAPDVITSTTGLASRAAPTEVCSSSGGSRQHRANAEMQGSSKVRSNSLNCSDTGAVNESDFSKRRPRKKQKRK